MRQLGGLRTLASGQSPHPRLASRALSNGQASYFIDGVDSYKWLSTESAIPDVIDPLNMGDKQQRNSIKFLWCELCSS